MARSPTSAPSDEHLARRAQQGCTESFEELVRRYQVRLLHFLRHRGARADAEDLLQETFVRAFTHLGRYRHRWRFGTWLFTIARRLSINHHRQLRPPADGTALEAMRSPVPDPSQVAAEAEQRTLLWDAAAAALSEEEYTALWMFYVEEMPVREIAALVGRSWVAAKTMLFRARKKLMPELRRLDPDQLRQPTPIAAEPTAVPPVAEACYVETISEA